MRDIALVWDNVNGRADFAIENGDLVMDETPWTALLISWFCDRVADPSDVIPDGSGNRRGFWADTPSPNDAASAFDFTGSKLWLIMGLQVSAALQQAEAYISQASAWAIADGVVDSVTPVATFPARGLMNIAVATVWNGVPETRNFSRNVN